MNFTDAVVLEPALHYALFGISEEFEHLLVEFHVDWLKLFSDVFTIVVRELAVGKRFASLSFRLSEICYRGAGHRVQWDRLRELHIVFVVADFLKMNMSDLLWVKVLIERVMSGHVAGQFREVRGHFFLF